MDKRSRLKAEYKQTRQPMGVLQIKNELNGKILVDSSMNVGGRINRHRAELRTGSHRNKTLQKEWNENGADSFSFNVLEYLEPNEDEKYDYREDLALLEEIWMEKLQPFDEKGYNKEPER